MTPAERFVVVAGVSLLVFNLILFSLCISLVLDSKAAKNDTAQLIALTGRLLENQQATPSPKEVRTTTLPALKQLETTSSQQANAAEGCPLLQRSTSATTSQPEVPETQGVTEVAQSTEADYEETSQRPSDEEKKIRLLEERIASLEKTVKLLENRELTVTLPPNQLRRRRNGGERTSLLS